MAFEGFQRFIGKLIRALFAIMLFFVIVSMIYAGRDRPPPEVRDKIRRQMVAELYGLDANFENYPKPWPPAMNQTYPDYELVDHEGKQFKISDHQGKIVIIEMVDVFSPLSLAYSGAAQYGLFGKADSFDQYAKSIGALLAEQSEGAKSLPHPEVVTIKVIINGAEGGQATVNDAEKWAEFYRLSKENNVIVAVPVKDMRGKTTDGIVPGYQLLDKEMVLRVDAAGPVPKHNLEMTLVPYLSKMLDK